jgi:hypothetical protein
VVPLTQIVPDAALMLMWLGECPLGTEQQRLAENISKKLNEERKLNLIAKIKARVEMLGRDAFCSKLKKNLTSYGPPGKYTYNANQLNLQALLMVTPAVVAPAAPTAGQNKQLAQRPLIDLSPRQPEQLNPPGTQIKKDIRGFFLGMPQAEVEKQLRAIGCQTKSFVSFSCDLKDGRLDVKLTKGVVDGVETEVVTELSFDFESSAGPEQVIAEVATDFHVAPPRIDISRELIAEAKVPREMSVPIFGKFVVWGGDIASWLLEDNLSLVLSVGRWAENRPNYKANADEYHLTIKSHKELDAVKQAKDAEQRKRELKAPPKF